MITAPDDKALDALCDELAASARDLDDRGDWPRRQLARCAETGVYRWFLPTEYGGLAWNDADVLRGYLRLSEACLTTTFILTQWSASARRIADSANEALKTNLLPDLANGAKFTTVGVSHLTTSRRHLAKPVLRAEETEGGFLLDGYSPWVTGAVEADVIVTGATLADGRQILVALPMDAEGVRAEPPARLVGLSASQTGAVRLDKVMVRRELSLAGPGDDVMGTGGGSTGGLPTSALAIGLAAAAVTFLESESQNRRDLKGPTVQLRREQAELADLLIRLAAGDRPCSTEELRARSNSIALRAAQAALSAAKGTGYVVGHPAGRWCREALFFLVWSCPHPVAAANLCELAGLAP